MIPALGYCIHSILLYQFSDETDYQVLYKDTLDWGNRPNKSAIVCVSIVLFVLPCVHLLQVVIFKTKLKLFDRYDMKKHYCVNDVSDSYDSYLGLEI